MALLPNRSVDRIAIATGERLFAEQNFALQFHRQTSGDNFNEVDFGVTESTRLVPENPERTQRHRGRGDRNANRRGGVVWRFPGLAAVGLFEHHGVAGQRFEVALAAAQAPGGIEEALVREPPMRAQFQEPCVVVEQVQRCGLALHRLGAAPQDGLQALGQLPVFFLRPNDQGDRRCQVRFAMPQRGSRRVELVEQRRDALS